ncbi:MAG: rhodanese-like domain-containing protein [Candidatus Omnitrophica bacterium]|nr:rhodanese-like domain-containing protein [Candidatus Omnitrophota bacterium]
MKILKFSIMILFFLLLLFLFARKSFAFLPPEFLVQTFSSIGIILASGVALAIIPLIAVRLFLKRNKRIIVILLVNNVILGIAIGFFFYYRYYLPVRKDSYLVRPLAPKLIGDNVRKYGISMQAIEEEEEKKRKVCFIDIREPEEFAVGHCKKAYNERGVELSKERIKKIFKISDKDFQEILFIIYCHDGDRSIDLAKRMNLPNIKYLIGGVLQFKENLENFQGLIEPSEALFGKEYTTKYQINVKLAADIIKSKKSVVVDVRGRKYYEVMHIKGSQWFRIGNMTFLEVEEAMEKLTKQLSKRKQLVVIANGYGDLFYAQLLIYRLIRDYNLSEIDYNILFNQIDYIFKYYDIPVQK